MNSKLLAGLVLAIAVIGGSLALFANKDDETAATERSVATEPAAPSVSTTAIDSAAATEPAPIVLAQADTAARKPSGRFQLGEHYQRLTPTQPTSSSPDQVEVAEIFWYGCNHCYNFDPYVENWLEKKPDGVSFVRVPAVWNPLVKLHARAFYTAEALGKGEEMHTPFFREIHVRQNLLESEASLREFFGRFGVSADEFKAAFDSFAVHTKLQRAETLAQRYRVSSVPMIVVNGKYTTSASATGGYDGLMEVIDELVSMEKADAS